MRMYVIASVMSANIFFIIGNLSLIVMAAYIHYHHRNLQRNGQLLALSTAHRGLPTAYALHVYLNIMSPKQWQQCAGNSNV